MEMYATSDNNFNSIKVRLNHKGKDEDRKIMLFQFHKGTIKPLRGLCVLHGAYEFQFHKGTIKPICKLLL